MPLMSKAPYTGDCMLNPRVSEFNYMPYRIRLPRRFGGDCLTVNQGVELTVLPCIAYEMIKRHGYRINGSYSISQLFYLHPHKPSRQYIGHNRYTKFEDDHVCIFRTYADDSVSLESCSLKGDKKEQLMQVRWQLGSKVLVQFKFGKLCMGYSAEVDLAEMHIKRCLCSR